MTADVSLLGLNGASDFPAQDCLRMLCVLQQFCLCCCACRKWYSGAAYDYTSNFTHWMRNNPDDYWRQQGRNIAFLVDNGMFWDDYFHNHYLEFVCEKKLGN